MKKKFLFLVFLLLLFAACGNEKPEITTISVMTEGSAQSFKEIEIDNVKIHVQQVQVGTLVQRVLNDEVRPDVVYLDSKEDMELIKEHLMSVEELELDGYDRAKFANKDYEEIEARHASADGEHYVLPDYGVSRDGVERAWFYRADVFEKLGLTPPETMSELTEVCLKLKAEYKDSTPLVIRDGYYGLDLVAPSWKNDASIAAYYDFEKGKWSYGLSESWAGNFISYWANMYKAGLVPENYLTMKSDEADALINNDLAFITVDYLWKMDEKWQMMPPPRADIETGQHKIAKREAPFAGIAICKSAENKKAAVFAAVDAFFINSLNKTEIVKNDVRIARIYTEEKINPSRYVSVPQGEDEQRVRVHLQGMLSAFLKGEIKMTRWEDFAAQLEEKGAKGIINLKKSAYNNAKK